MTDINRFVPYREGRHPVFSSTENGCTHIAHNQDRNDVRQFKIDGDVFPEKTDPQRCDYLLLNDTKKPKGDRANRSDNQGNQRFHPTI